MSSGPNGPWIRKCIFFSYLLTVVLIGVPIWIKTTSIYRAPLPYDDMEFYDKNIDDQILINVPVYLNIGPEFPDLVEASQKLIDSDLHDLGIKQWRVVLIKGKGGPNDYNMELGEGEKNLYDISTHSRDIRVTYTLELLSIGRIADLICGVLLDHLFQPEIETMRTYIEDHASTDDKVVGYSNMYHLTFSLLYGGGDPIEWDIDEALHKYFTPLRESLSRVTNFTVDTQVQYYSSPGCAAIKDPELNAVVLDQSDLSTFVNFAEWSLTSIHSYPTLHFILYIPAEDQTPMTIQGSQSNSFLIPQWGGVTILNRKNSSQNHYTADDLLPALETFSSQCLSLLGAPSLPKSPPIRIDSLSRISTIRALKSASSTLGSLTRLVLSLQDIAIPPPVLDSVQKTVKSIQKSLESLKLGQWNTAIKSAGNAEANSEKAFFDKMMVQQVFFPQEHKVAIYLPLLGPAFVVIFSGLSRIIKDFKSTAQDEEYDKKTVNTQTDH